MQMNYFNLFFKNRAQAACLNRMVPLDFIEKYNMKMRAWQPYHVHVIIEVVSHALSLRVFCDIEISPLYNLRT